MTPDKEEALCTKYPKIFHLDPHCETRVRGLEVDDGWYDILDALCSSIQGHVDYLVGAQRYRQKTGEVPPEEVVPDHEFQVVASQVKEKFGGLRFYTESQVDDWVYGAISMAEVMSLRTCEGCGVPATRTEVGRWIKVLCERCRVRHEEARVTAWSRSLEEISEARS